MSRTFRFIALPLSVCLGFVTASNAQIAEVVPQELESTARHIAPVVIPVSGQLLDTFGVPRAGSLSLRLALYVTAVDRDPLWVEEQVATLDATGHYVVQLGATTRGGVPHRVFTAGSALWVGVTVAGEPEQPRGAVSMAPYAAKALNADALGGASAADYLRTDQVVSRVMAALRLLKTEEAEGSGSSGGGATLSSFASTTANRLAMFLDSSGTIGDSAVIDVSGQVGIGTNSPASLFHVRGAESSNWIGTIENSAAGGYSSYFGYNNGTARYGLYVAGGGDDQYSYYLLTDDQKFGVRGDGRVGVGAVPPTAALHVRGVETGNWVGIVENGSPGGHSASFGFNNGVTRYGVYVSGGAADSSSYYFLTDGERFGVRGDGRVGIGTSSPVRLLDVRGDAQFTGAVQVAGAATLAGGASVTGNLSATGNITATGSIAAKYQDVAEWVDAVEPLPAGTVVAADPASINKVRRSQRAYDSAVLGVVSTQPGLLLGEAAEGRVAVAQSGRVLVKVDASTGAIKPGDLLVASAIPGYAMLSRPAKNGMHRPGTIIGKALQGLATGRGEILVLITLQ
jgi:hypothetical protein